MQVSHVMSAHVASSLRASPGREPGGAPVCHLLRLQIQRPQIVETPASYRSEFIEQLRRLLPWDSLCVPQPIEWIKRLSFAELQNPLARGSQSFAVRVNQVPNDIENGPGIFPSPR